jgi:glutamate N-acetyltransferase/amino-acid N-acetyltransferase
MATEVTYDKVLANTILSGKHIKIIVDLKNGKSKATAWGCDLTYEYVKANGYLS